MLPLLLLATVLCASPARAAPLRLVTEEVPPSVMKQGERITGYSADKVRTLMERTHTPYTMTMYAWSRSFSLAQTQADTCVFPMARLPEREALFKWVGPLHASDWMLVGRARDRHVLRSLDDARGLRIGSYVGDYRARTLQEHGLQVEFVADDALNIKKLLMGRIDLWVASRRHAEIEIERRGLKGQLVPLLTFRRTDVYLACNRALPDAEIARLNAGWHAMLTDGTVAVIEARYTQSRE
ncbi:ABC transporter substrate-binding protein [Massilia sp. TS11]|uniref:substrate-binding periplasmic protein n=1 Tax=Massilia sp. TS11 TaxID=2908003 RepID=UPI001EDB1087|nr:ABC transporter substrate-binding protein [Massilia sp. TS11]MCG2584993.1 ABC transporter substrate-binding protein [Massilia sp. TS11]